MQQELTIGCDARRIVRNRTGLGNYGRTLIRSLVTEYPEIHCRLYAPDPGSEDLRAQVAFSPQVSFVYPEHTHNPLYNTLMKRGLWRSWAIVRDLRRDRIPLFHGLSGELPLGLKTAGIHGVVTIHDLIFLRHPEYYHWADVQIYRWKFLKTLKEASRIIAISECTKRDILKFGQFPEDQIDVIYQACNMRFTQPVGEDEKQAVRGKYHLPERFLLSVGTIEERKNMLLAVKALLKLPVDLHLVLIGRSTPYAEMIRRFVVAHDLVSRVQVLHGVPDRDLQAIYQQAECFVYPSRYEGFGIPILEAVESRLPVVAATGSCLEEAGGPDSLYVGPDDEEGWVNAITQSLKDAPYRQQRIQRSLEYVRRFENRNLARQMWKEYERVLHS